MQFGLFMMPSHPPHRSIADSYDRDLAIIMTTDRRGYNEAWIGEHITEQWEHRCLELLMDEGGPRISDLN